MSVSADTTGHLLTSDQIAFFKQHGFVVVPGLVEPVYVEAWRDHIWSHLGEDRTDPATWHKREYVLKDLPPRPDLALGDHPRTRGIIRQLGGGTSAHPTFGGAQTSPLVIWPRGETIVPRRTHGGHVDGYTGHGFFPFTIAATFYLDPVSIGGGGFHYWPGSHLTTWRFFQQHPEILATQWCTTRYKETADRLVAAAPPGGPVEFTANPGDVIFWHAYLCHTGGPNTSNHPRIGMFSRWGYGVYEGRRYVIPDDLWAYWAV